MVDDELPAGAVPVIAAVALGRPAAPDVPPVGDGGVAIVPDVPTPTVAEPVSMVPTVLDVPAVGLAGVGCVTAG